MPRARTFGFSLLLIAAAACSRPTPGAQAPKPLKPQDGPAASIHVDYTGGLLNRSLRAYFRTEQYAYVLVGHLGGDGRIRVLYPESPDESGFVRGKTYFLTSSTPAYYDAIPSLYSFTMSPYRGAAAMHDSYDGRGHGYVFLIASRTPLRYDQLYDYAGWAELEMEGYERHHDPRYAIRNFADVLAGGGRYTLKFATSMGTTSYSSYAMRQWDCAVLASMGMFSGFGAWSPFSFYRLGSRSMSSYCGTGRTFPMYTSGPIFTTVAQRPLDPPDVAPAPSLDRPGRRGFGPRTETPARTTLTRVSPSMPRDPAGGTSSVERRSARRPTYGTSRGRPAESADIAGRSRPSASRDNDSRASSPSTSRAGSSSSGSSSSGSSRPAASTSSGTRSNSQPTSSPRDERKRPDSE